MLLDSLDDSSVKRFLRRENTSSPARTSSGTFEPTAWLNWYSYAMPRARSSMSSIDGNSNVSDAKGTLYPLIVSNCVAVLGWKFLSFGNRGADFARLDSRMAPGIGGYNFFSL